MDGGEGEVCGQPSTFFALVALLFEKIERGPTRFLTGRVSCGRHREEIECIAHFNNKKN